MENQMYIQEEIKEVIRKQKSKQATASLTDCTNVGNKIAESHHS